jgi:hypothetical protein
MLVWDSGVVDGSVARKLADKGDGFGDGVGLPDVDRLRNVNPAIEGGEELNGMFFRTGDLRNGKEAGSPLRGCSNSASSRAEGLGIGKGAMGGVEPALLDGLDKVRAEGRAPYGIPTALERVLP